jgi:hypothetical protein
VNSLEDKKKLRIVKEELALETHNGTTKADLLMLLDWTYNRLIKGDLEARGMNVLEKILENVERLEDPYYKDYVDRKHAAEIIRSHMDEVPNCGKCSRRKWYQKGIEDGKKDNDWIPVEEKRVPEKEVIAQNAYDEMMIGHVYYSEEMKWYECVSDDVYLTNVVAWQPLPEPYIKNPK